MRLTHDDVEKIANLAQLTAQPQEIESLQRDLSNILDLVGEMDKVDTTDVEPMAHPLSMRQRLRVDAATEKDQRDIYQRIAPDTAKGLYLVPKVVE
jgi:aspartyl-tRNA(Asn)/glutamyl-tRNA(Gln) amidotransferase subunit C